ncbi:heme biosynthesis HemY N-terminal domain-containing protein [Pararhodobacter sp. SW119]|uniref:heme biosynthesis protein HemY n=1 Tax=Pararhodobacter sp. SW119 TaxID=2780075 RepID=UPI001AE05DED|nr:heme biosynthesis HemY N-terminal domain-containing protein [Pararhodobacter sp. SW119]
MLWTVLKIALFLAVVAGLALGAQWLMDAGPGIRIAVADVEFNLGPVQAALAALVVLALLWLLLKLAGFLVASLRFINGDDTAISRYFERSRKRRGLEALTEGFVALASGEGDRAVVKGRKAEKLLENRTLSNLLIAQGAQSKGNRQLAEDYYRRLLEEDRTRFIGAQGLLGQMLDAGNDEKARKLAEKVLTLKPEHAPTQDTLLRLQNRAGDWPGARRTLAETKRTGRMPADVYRRRDAVLALQQAQALEAEGRSDAARDLALEANGSSPGLIPAAVMAARAQIARGNARAAAKVIKKAWRLQPHPELAQAFAEIEPDEDATARSRRFEKLLTLVEHDEAKLTRAELLIAAEDFPAARRAIGTLHETAPSQRVMTIMAAIERGEGSDDSVVRGWLARALTAPRGPRWVCDKCQHIHASWTAICENCDAFDTLSWRTPPDSSGPSASGSEMLPLIVGTPRDRASVSDPEHAVDMEPEPHPATPADVAPQPADKTAGETAPDDIARRAPGV